MDVSGVGGNSRAKEVRQTVSIGDHRVSVQKAAAPVSSVPKEKIYDLNRETAFDAKVADDKWLKAHPTILREVKSTQKWLQGA